MREKLLIISLLVNLLLIGCLTYIIVKKGGLKFLKEKVGMGHPNSGYGPYYNQRKTLFEILPRDTADIIFVGHSLVDGCEWSELFNDPNIKNRGINGELVEGVIKRLDVLMKPPPRKIFLMTGANDLGNDKPITAVIDDFRKIVNALKLNCPATEVYLISLLPIGYDYEKGSAQLVTTLNAGLKEMAEANNYTYIDLFTLVKDEDNYFNPAFTNDGSHLMGAGYLKIKKKLEEYMN